MPDRLLSEKEVRQRAGGIGRSTLWRWERAGSFPRRRQVGPGRVGWRESEVDAWIRALPTANSQGASE